MSARSVEFEVHGKTLQELEQAAAQILADFGGTHTWKTNIQARVLQHAADGTIIIWQGDVQAWTS